MFYRHLLRVAASLAVLLFATPAAGQRPDTTHLSPERADHLAGLYTLEDDRLVYVLDLRDQLNGKPTLSLVEYASGRVRALYPLASGAFEAGNAWFRRESVEYRIQFQEESDDGDAAPALRWEEDGQFVSGYRVPLREREVSIRNGDVTLGGTLVLPPDSGPHPAVVMIPGSGPLTRRTPRYMGDLLAARGVAVLAMDKRGTGASTGEWRGLSHAEWATDVEAQLDFLHRQPAIDSGRLGLFASSEGGFVGPIVASRRDDVRFLVCRVCSAHPHRTVILDDQVHQLRGRGLAEADVQRGRELLLRIMHYAIERTEYDSLAAYAREGTGTQWRSVFPPSSIPGPTAAYWDEYRGVLEVDPGEYYAEMEIPVLVVLGEDDNRIIVRKHRRAFREMADLGLELTLWVVEGATHGLLLREDGVGITQYPKHLHGRIADWVVRHADVK